MNKKLMTLLCLGLFSIVISAQAALLPIKQHNNIAYIADNQTTELKRYDLTAESFLSSITLTESPKAFHVDDLGFYISYGFRLVHQELDGSNESTLRTTSTEVLSLTSIDNFIIAAGYDYLISLNQSTGSLIDEYTDTWYLEPEVTLDKDSRRLYISESGSIKALTIEGSGSFKEALTSYYNISSSRIYLTSDGKKILDKNAAVYASSNLQKLIAGQETQSTDIDFWQGLPIILRDGILSSYGKNFQETGSVETTPPSLTESFVVKSAIDDSEISLTINIDYIHGRKSVTGVINSSLTYAEGGTLNRGVLDGATSGAFVSQTTTGNYGNIEIYPDGDWTYWLDTDSSYLKQDIVVSNNKVYIFSLATNESSTVTVYDIAALTPDDPSAPIDGNTTNFDVDNYAVDANNDFLYLLSNAHHSVFVWSISKEQYIDTISISSTQTGFTYSTKWHRIYMSGTNGVLSYIDLSDNSVHQTTWNEPLNVLVTADEYLVGKTNNEHTQYLFDKDGTVIDSQWMPESFYDMAWDTNRKKLYHLSHVLTEQGLDTISGIFIDDTRNDNPFNISYLSEPLRISENGKYIASSSGTISSIFDLGVITDVLEDDYNLFADIAWLHGNLFSLKAIDSDTYSQVQRWDADFSANEDDIFETEGTPIALVSLKVKGQLIVIYQNDGKTSFATLSFTENDFDNDGHFDSQDELPADASDYLDYDGDGIGNTLDNDDDNDGASDSEDAFPLDEYESLDTDSDNIGNNRDLDDDGDGVADIDDLFPINGDESIDSDWDSIGNNADTDDDNDGVLDTEDAFPLNEGEHADYDKDGIGNNADQDDDNDGVEDYQDVFPLNENETSDLDDDGQGDNSDDDIDGDYVNNTDDAFPLNQDEWLDTDADGTGNNTDTDDDGDGVPDSQDYYPTNSAKSALNASDYLPLNNGNTWTYSSRAWYEEERTRITAKIDSAISVAGHSISPLSFSSGAELYLKAVDNKVQIFGFYLPEVWTNYGVFSTDFRLSQGINLFTDNNSSGGGSVDVRPTYGSKSITWTAGVTYKEPEYITVGAGSFNTLRTKLTFNGTTTIDGASVNLYYEVELWFAEGVGIVKIEEQDYTTQLTQYNVTPSTPSTGSGSTTSSNGGGDSSGSGGSFGWIILALSGLMALRKRVKTK